MSSLDEAESYLLSAREHYRKSADVELRSEMMQALYCAMMADAFATLAVLEKE